ncbi:MAG: hypothetical protein ACK4GE_04015 [Caldimicrobium sp.]
MWKRSKQQGTTILEVLIALLIFILAIVGFMKGYTDLMLYLKGSKMNARAKELGEKLKAEIQNRSYEDLRNCFNPTQEGKLIYNGTQAYFDFDNPTFYSDTCPNFGANCTSLSCLYCYVNERLEPATHNCSSGYPIRVGYNSRLVMYEDPESLASPQEIGLAIAIKLYYNEPKTNIKREIKYLVFKRRDENL